MKRTGHPAVLTKMRSLFTEKETGLPLLGAYHLSAEQVEEMLDSFELTIPLAREIRAIPVVLEGAEAVSNVPVPTKLVPEDTTGTVLPPK